jgi:hypothetical protein
MIPLENMLRYGIYFPFLQMCAATTNIKAMRKYRASQKDVPDFNNLLLEFNITQVNRISIDGKENSPTLFRHITNVQYVLHP